MKTRTVTLTRIGLILLTVFAYGYAVDRMGAVLNLSQVTEAQAGLFLLGCCAGFCLSMLVIAGIASCVLSGRISESEEKLARFKSRIDSHPVYGGRK